MKLTGTEQVAAAALAHRRAVDKARKQKYRSEGRCVECGLPAARSRRSKNGLSQWCLGHLLWYRDYIREYMRSRAKQTKEI